MNVVVDEKSTRGKRNILYFYISKEIKIEDGAVLSNLGFGETTYLRKFNGDGIKVRWCGAEKRPTWKLKSNEWIVINFKTSYSPLSVIWFWNEPFARLWGENIPVEGRSGAVKSFLFPARIPALTLEILENLKIWNKRVYWTNTVSRGEQAEHWWVWRSCFKLTLAAPCGNLVNDLREKYTRNSPHFWNFPPLRKAGEDWNFEGKKAWSDIIFGVGWYFVW